MSILQKLGFGNKEKKDKNKVSSPVVVNEEKTKKTNFIKSIFSHKKLDEQSIEDLEDMLIMSDIGTKASSKIISNFAKKRIDKKLGDKEIRELLASDILSILKPCEKNLEINHNPHIILMVGVNGAGKTTSIGKLTAKLKKQNKKISLIAGDTFRAAAVEQLKIWGDRNNIRIFHGEPNCNSAGLCYDGINQALKEKDDIVFIDTAGRLQNKAHLMDELKKIIKVIKKIIPDAPHTTLLTLDATTGQNALDQTKVFKEMLNIDGIIITKLDGTAKGGIIVAIAEETQTPIYYIGLGEGIDDLQEFNAKSFANNLLEI